MFEKQFEEVKKELLKTSTPDTSVYMELKFTDYQGFEYSHDTVLIGMRKEKDIEKFADEIVKKLNYFVADAKNVDMFNVYISNNEFKKVRRNSGDIIAINIKKNASDDGSLTSEKIKDCDIIIFKSINREIDVGRVDVWNYDILIDFCKTNAWKIIEITAREQNALIIESTESKERKLYEWITT